ncbi:DEAD box RNA helicase [Haematococcus lacustris]|uniref:RNA helicase n=1 Tax=Haematococcus lacustris TaxID=44745 RepID=A0A699YXN6_HAELA|nr:DEAD box RNA helicase [Haematococcus lacustris]
MATNGASDALKLERLLKKLKHALKAGDTDGVAIMSKKIVKAGGTVPEVSPGAKRKAEAEVGDVNLARSGKAIVKALYKEAPEVAAMTAAESQCWPIVLSGRDLIGIAATGSGKTLGFGLPMMAHINAQKAAGVVGRTGPYAVVMAPTRELALQINAVLEDAGSKCGVSSVCVYGGVSKKEQVDALRKGVEVVVGTPGRVRDLMSSDVLKLRHVEVIEPHARDDRLLQLLSRHHANRSNRIIIFVLYKKEAPRVEGLLQRKGWKHVEVIEPHARDDRLLQLLSRHHANRSNRIIIFVLYKKEAPRVEGLLQRKGWKCAAIHGDISQDRRTAAVDDFKSGRVPLLIATDVVINYSFPLTTEDYVHRIGRTGRAGKTGLAFTFFCAAADKPRAGELINVLKEAGQKVCSSVPGRLHKA